MSSSVEILIIYKRLFEKFYYKYFRYLNRKYFIRKIWWEKELIIFVWIIVNYSNLKQREFKLFTQ